MKQSELKKVVDFYQNVICQQIIKPVEIREIYKLVKPDGMDVPYFQKMRAITVYVQSLQKEVLDGLEEMFEEFDEEQETITSDPRLSTYIPKDSAASPLAKNSETDTQSHEEDADSELVKLERAYEAADNANQKRSLKMKINKLKKQL